MDQFFPGLHQPSDLRHFYRACISVNRMRDKQVPIKGKVFLDCGAFTELEMYGKYRREPEMYAKQIARIVFLGIADIVIAVSQDYMCEQFMLERTGLTIESHQKLTIERYDALLACKPPCLILPVIQGYSPESYAMHVKAYGYRLKPNAWVGVGSVCKRNSNPQAVVEVLEAIASIRPDLRLHGFGIKITALEHPVIRKLLYTGDSLSWSYAARVQGRNQNDWREAAAFVERIESYMRRDGPLQARSSVLRDVFGNWM